MSGPVAPPRVRKHLMVPGQPRQLNPEPMSLSRVQRWVLSTLAATTILHLAVGLVIAAAVAGRPDARVGLLVIASALGVLAVVAALLVHRKRPLSPWLLLGLLPGLVGAWFVF